MKTLDELDALHAAATGQRLTPSPVAFEVAATQAWPAISARLRAADEIVKAVFVWSQAHDGIDGGLDEARQALFEAVERRRAMGEP